MTNDIYLDERTLKPEELAQDVHPSRLIDTGHYFTGWDGMVYRLVGWRRGDGPWMEEIFGRSKTRTVSCNAIGGTFHHHNKCPMPECRAWADVGMAFRYPGGLHRTVEWSDVEQTTDGTTIWINSKRGMNIGRLSPRGIDVHHDTRQRLNGGHCLFCEPALNPRQKHVTFAMYVRFCEKMQEHHKVGVSRALPIRIAEESL